jgi:hypothetical protein
MKTIEANTILDYTIPGRIVGNGISRYFAGVVASFTAFLLMGVWAGILSAGPFSMDLALRMAAIVSPISGWMFGEALKMWWEDYRRKRLTVSDSMVRSAANAYASAACDDGHRYPTGPNNDKHKEYMRKALLEVLSR